MYFDDMEHDLSAITGDQLETELIRLEQLVARIRQTQTRLISEADRRQQPLADGCRTLIDWVASRLDVTHHTARDLVTLTRNETEGLSGWSFDRQVALTRLAAVKNEPVDPQDLARFDLTGIRRLVAHHRRVTRNSERDVVADRYVALQPSLDRDAWKLWGLLGADDGALVEQALTIRADQLPSPPDGLPQTRGQKQADALTSLCLDTLTNREEDTGSNGSGPVVTVVCDTRDAAPTNGQTGVTVVSGPRVGPQALEAVLCDGTIDVVALTKDGTPLGVGQTTSTLPPRIRRFVLARDQACTIDGCRSRYRLQPHHIHHRAWGGAHDTENLTTLCWWHHHRVIHGYGYRIDPDSPPHRRRLKPPATGPPP